MAIAFEQHVPLLWRVLAELARHGYVAPPSDAQDLIHDFYAEAWSGLEQRYDPASGGLDSYLFGAFYRFARRRILQTQAWRSRFVHVPRLADYEDRSPGPEEIVELEDQLREVREALSGLPKPQENVLRDYLGGGEGGERNLAQKYHLSRYQVRELLAEALGRVAKRLARPSSESTIDGRVAGALWEDGRTVRDAARALGVSVPEVRAALNRNVRRLMASLRGRRPANEEGGRKLMAGEALTFLKQALLSPEDGALLQKVRHNAGSIREALEKDEVELSEEELRRVGGRPEWTAKVYQALAEGERAPDREQAIAEAMRKIHDDEDREIAAAFKSLVETLPKKYGDWAQWFPKVPAAPKDYQDDLRRQPVVRLSLPEAEGLVVRGMTPATLLEASRGVELLLNRLIRTALGAEERWPKQPELARLCSRIQAGSKSGGPPCVDVVLNGDRPEQSDSPTVPYGLLVAQARGTPQTPAEAAEPLLHWMVEAAQLKPFFFNGYEAATLGNRAIRLKREATRDGAELAFRWGRHVQKTARREPVPC